MDEEIIDDTVVELFFEKKKNLIHLPLHGLSKNALQKVEMAFIRDNNAMVFSVRNKYLPLFTDAIREKIVNALRNYYNNKDMILEIHKYCF